MSKQVPGGDFGEGEVRLTLGHVSGPVPKQAAGGSTPYLLPTLLPRLRGSRNPPWGGRPGAARGFRVQGNSAPAASEGGPAPVLGKRWDVGVLAAGAGPSSSSSPSSLLPRGPAQRLGGAGGHSTAGGRGYSVNVSSGNDHDLVGVHTVRIPREPRGVLQGSGAWSASPRACGLLHRSSQNRVSLTTLRPLGL